MEVRRSELDYALWYADLGWPVIPAHTIKGGACTCRKRATCGSPGKHPHTRNGLKDATTDGTKIRKSWSRWKDANVAVVTGADSDLVVIDVDPDHGGRGSLEAIRGRLGGLPKHPIVRTGGGGVHLLFQHPGGYVGNRQGLAPGIDIRADGGYVIAPCSVHASGSRYEWDLDPETVAPPTLPDMWLDWLLSGPCHTDSAESADTQDIQGGIGGVFAAGEPLERVVKKAIRATLPTGPGQRHRALFELARWLKAHPAIADASTKMLKPYVRQWHERAKPLIRTKPFEESWFDFAEGWRKVKHPKGTGSMAAILERAAAAEPPAVAMGYEQEKLRLLVALCRELQREAGDGPFFLSVRTAAELIGVSPRHVSRWLNGLVVDEVLRRVSMGSYRSRHASQYCYTGDDRGVN